jgi:hypothetical protein
MNVAKNRAPVNIQRDFSIDKVDFFRKSVQPQFKKIKISLQKILDSGVWACYCFIPTFLKLNTDVH